MRALGAIVQEGLAQLAGWRATRFGRQCLPNVREAPGSAEEKVKQVVAEMGWSLQEQFAEGARLEGAIRQSLGGL